MHPTTKHSKSLLFSLLIFFFSPLQSAGQDKELLIEKWDLTYFSAIEKIESSLAMQLADSVTFNLFEKSKRIMLDDIFYQFFANETMKYCDIENTKLVIREAYWKLDKDVLTITEFERPFERKAKILHLSESSMELVPIIDGDYSPGSKMIFRKLIE